MAHGGYQLIKEVIEKVKKARKPRVPKEGTLGQRLADRTAAVIGSWTFIIAQSVILVGWILINLFTPWKFDPFPFIFLNLMLSFQAAFAGPVIMMAANRTEQIDRKRSIDNHNLSKQDHKRLVDMFTHIDRHFDSLNIRLDDMEEKIQKNSDKT